MAAAAVAVIALGARTLRRNIDWKDNLTLALATLEMSPSSPLMNDMAGKEPMTRGDVPRAVSYYEAALKEAPDASIVHSHLGAAYLAVRAYDRAADEYRRVIALDPGTAEAHSTLGL